MSKALVLYYSASVLALIILSSNYGAYCAVSRKAIEMELWTTNETMSELHQFDFGYSNDRSLIADYKQLAPWQSDYSSEDRVIDPPQYVGCWFPTQACTFFQIFNTTYRRRFSEAIDYCPPTPHCNSDKVECVRIGSFCRNSFNCATVSDNCCSDCQNL